MVSHYRLAFSLFLLLGLFPASGSAEGQRVYDGHWWLSASSAEQNGFLNGYFDCNLYECKGPARYRFPVDLYQLQLTKFFQQVTTSGLNEPVSEVLDQFRDPPGVTVIDKYAEPVKEPHGGNDGLYWRQMWAAGGRAEQMGFIEGYSCCHSRLNHNKGGTFSKAPADYVSLITNWYGFKESSGDVDEKREPVSIADVLYRFRDRAPL